MSESAVGGLTGYELVERLMAVHSTIAAAQAEEVALMTQLYRMRRAQQLELGVRALYAGEDAATEIGVALKVSQRHADGVIAIGLDLDARLPNTREAFADGRIDMMRARAIRDVLVNASDELVAIVEPRIAAYAENADPARVKRTLRRWLLELDPAGQAARRKAAEADRYVNVQAADNGTAILDGVLPALGAQTLYERLREMSTTQCCTDDPRNTNQRRADALVALADGTGRLSCQCGRDTCPRADTGESTPARKALVQVGISAETLAGLQDNPALLAGFGAIDPDLARQIARYANFDLIPPATAPERSDVHSATSAGHATIHTSSVAERAVDHGANSGTRAVRQFSEPTAAGSRVERAPVASGSSDAEREARYRPGVRLAGRVRAIDGGCRAPGCGVPAAATDLDHQERFDHRDPENGGRTTESNLGCRCRRHHRLKTLADNGANGWKVIHHEDRRVEWRSPTGGSVTTSPEGAKFLFPRIPVPAVTAGGVPEPEPVEPLINPGFAINELTELVHVYCTPSQRRRKSVRVEVAGIEYGDHPPF